MRLLWVGQGRSQKILMLRFQNNLFYDIIFHSKKIRCNTKNVRGIEAKIVKAHVQNYQQFITDAIQLCTESSSFFEASCFAKCFIYNHLTAEGEPSDCFLFNPFIEPLY